MKSPGTKATRKEGAISTMSRALAAKEVEANNSLIPLCLVQLLVGRITHDLSGPAGALANGVEMAVEGGALDPAIAGLIGYSSESLLARLNLLGFAFGLRASADPSSLDGAGEAAHRYMKGKPHLRLAFPTGEAPSGVCALLLILVINAADCLKKQGEIRVEYEVGQDQWRVIAAGGLRIDEGLTDLLQRGLGAPNNRTIVAYMASRFALQLGLGLIARLEQGDEGEQLIVTIGKSNLTNTET
jgi:histidine phosphotransferase ChpT